MKYGKIKIIVFFLFVYDLGLGLFQVFKFYKNYWYFWKTGNKIFVNNKNGQKGTVIKEADEKGKRERKDFLLAYIKK